MFLNRNSQIWSPLPSMPTPRLLCQAGLVTYPNGDKGILVAGGYNQAGLTTVDFLNLDTLIWEPKLSLPIDIYYGASVPFKDSFLIVGGYSQDLSYLDSVYYYNPNVDQWELMKTMDYGKVFSASFMVPDSFANCS